THFPYTTLFRSRHLEHEYRDQIDGQDQVDLEQVQPAAQQEQRVDGRQEELRQAVAAEEQVEDALGAGHRGIALHTRPARVISNAGPPRSLTERARATYTRCDGPPALRRAPPLPQRAPRLARGQSAS